MPFFEGAGGFLRSGTSQDLRTRPGFLVRPRSQLGCFHFLVKIDKTERETPQGHQWYLQAEDGGGAERRFLEDFGNIVHWNGPLGVRHTFTEHMSAFRIQTPD